MFNVNIAVEENKILGEFVADSYFFEPRKYDYAFYLYRNGEKIDAQWYSEKMEATFNIESTEDIFYIKAFVRDLEHKDIRTYNSEKTSICS